MTPRATGIAFAITAVVIFSIQDGISKYLGSHYPPPFVAMIRYWAFAAFAIALAARSRKGLVATAKTSRPFLQILRGVLLVVQIIFSISAFAIVGLAQSQAVLQSAPLMVALLSVPILGEKVGWRRWTAIIVGFFGVMLVMTPDAGSVDKTVLLPLIGALLFALYGITTRLAARTDTAMTSFFYTGVAGAGAVTLIGPFFWTSFAPADMGWMALLCLTGMSGHYLLIRAFDLVDAVVVQSMSYVQLVLVTIIGVMLFGEQLGVNMVIGSLIVVGAGAFTIYRESRLRIEPAIVAPAGEI